MEKRMQQRLNQEQVERLKLTDVEIYEILHNEKPVEHYNRMKAFIHEKYTYEEWLSRYITQRRGKLDYEASVLLGIGRIIEVLHTNYKCFVAIDFDCNMWDVKTKEKTEMISHGDDEAEEELIDVLYRAWYYERAKEGIVEYEVI